MKVLLIIYLLIRGFDSLELDLIDLSADYFALKDVKYLCYLSCENLHDVKVTSKKFLDKNVRISVRRIDETKSSLERFLNQWNVPIGVLLDASCENSNGILEEASKKTLFDATHMWLVLANDTDNATIEERFLRLNLSVDADIVVVHYDGDRYRLTDVYNFGRIQGNGLETYHLGSWGTDAGLEIKSGFKYYRRWDFHNLTLRAVSVILEKPKVFRPEMLLDVRYTEGVAAMTKVASQLLKVLMEEHNFRFNYTIASRWIGEPERNSTLAVTNSLFWREQDISCTSARIFPKWLEWVDIFYPPASKLESKFFYLIPDKGVGDYENRFLAPMSPGVWRCAGAAGVLCALVLAAGAVMEGRPKPGFYAFFSVIAAVGQQAYEDGVFFLEERFSSQGRRTTLLVIGLTSMLLYNYYTSSVVSWLLNAAAPSIATMDGLIASDLELVFEDIGYARGWLDNPGFYYFSGFKNVKEDELREKKVIRAKRTTPLLQRPKVGLELVRKGGYAYHTEPYTASQVISRTFEDREICALGSLQMMVPAPVYIMAQKRSPYGQFFIWSLMRLLERGHIKASRARVGGEMPACSGRTPRALALGQAAPAFLLLFQLTFLSVFILLVEILWYRITKNRSIKTQSRNNRAHNAQLRAA
ncbi:hypothetical protein ABMA28_015316 [Loxostege sticticalis]|uniref:Ionotropic receptor 75a N-terminal domain-containing protein n=1 Tax=Loxostege sticticalis TaxID=481309 RepID=A0ABD0T9M9_LOXSC